MIQGSLCSVTMQIYGFTNAPRGAHDTALPPSVTYFYACTQRDIVYLTCVQNQTHYASCHITHIPRDSCFHFYRQYKQHQPMDG